LDFEPFHIDHIYKQYTYEAYKDLIESTKEANNEQPEHLDPAIVPEVIIHLLAEFLLLS